ncbi:MAG: YdcF family protein [Cyclobacteriaceae bacterium]|nr:YdcF family protein [Cyclobacteriaceae bacterium]
MFFTLSKILGYLASPLVWVSLLFIGALLIRGKQKRRKLLVTGLSTLIFFSNEFISNEVMLLWEIPATPYADVVKHYNYGILLTGVTSTDTQPDDRVYFQRGADRVVHTVDLYKRGIISRILIAGGSGRLVTEGRREADDIFKALVLMGVDSVDLEIENESRNTYESAVNVEKMIGKEAGELLLITSAYHMRRSRACFHKAGLTVDVFSTDFHTHPRMFTPDVLFIPKVDALLNWQRLIKEWVGIMAYKLAGYL